jgi:DnaJ-class molecular chaperone
MSEYKCSYCNGEGVIGDGVYDSIAGWEFNRKCKECQGTGEVDIKTRMKYVRQFKGMEEGLRNIILRNKWEMID